MQTVNGEKENHLEQPSIIMYNLLVLKMIGRV